MVCDGDLALDMMLIEAVALVWIEGRDFYRFRLIAKPNRIFLIIKAEA